MPKIHDLTGQAFGRLTVAHRAPNDFTGKTVWTCLCECGNEKNIRATALCDGLTKSCGCLRPGLRKTRLYTIWSHMKQRCENPNSNKFYLYGGRGIYVCEEWRENFITFYNWALANGYSESLTIDRIDGEKGYESSNCRWATTSEQNFNRRPYKLKSKRVHKKGVLNLE